MGSKAAGAASETLVCQLASSVEDESALSCDVSLIVMPTYTVK